MSQDFFEATQKTLPRLNQTERALFDYVVKNMATVKDMSIQRLAADRYLSTTTIFRFAQKLGFAGYSDFINSLLVTEHRSHSPAVPAVVQSRAYCDEYLKNVMEAVRVMPSEKVEQIRQLLEGKPNVYILTDNDTNDIGRYAEKLFLGLGLRTYFPEVDYQVTAMLDMVQGDDLIIALSYMGEDLALINTLEHIFFDKKPFLLSVTRADNNSVQNMSDANFYVFADEIHLNGIDLTSRVSMLMILELIVYGSMTT
ncbi:MAG: MurR/RpiR family transcriptional regulator [Coriobacteriales bacterium]|jgi:RpiR family glv operon transcriptional regulator|nr:MurR/RpiR family transcriptional regulator [Coriobacteriales bacterium]